MLDRFNELLQGLALLLDLPLHIDKHHACAIQIQPGLIIQLQADKSQENLLIVCKVVELPPGRFRENVLKEALKANALPDPRVGTFSYLALSNHLVLFQNYPFDVLNRERVAGLLGPFIEAAGKWRTAIQQGQSKP